MKFKYLLVFTLLPVLGQAQFDRYVLVEWFTNTYCGICSSKNPGLQEIYDSYSQGLHRITIHPDVPYPQCSLHNFNAEDNSARQSYYNVGATPTVFMNGDGVSTNNPLSFADGINARLGQSAPISIQVDEVGSNQVKVTINSASNQTGDYRLFVALLEKHLDFAAPNGENEHFDVLRDLISSREGDQITLPASGESKEYNYSFTVPDGVVAEETYILAFVQNFETKEILNSGTRFDAETTGTSDISLKSGLEVFPNPANDQFRLRVGNGYLIHQVDLYNQTGQKIRSQSMLKPEESVEIFISDLPSGTYLVKVNLGENTAAVPVLKK